MSWSDVVAWQIVVCTGRMTDHPGFERAHPERWAYTEWGGGNLWALMEPD